MNEGLQFEGTGGELFRRLFWRGALTALTLGAYLPWFFAEANRAIYERASFRTSSGILRFSITARPGELALLFLRGGLLSALTLGLYSPWFFVVLQRYLMDHTHLTRDGRVVGKCTFTGTGGELARTAAVGGLLVLLTLGTYGPWFHVRFSRYLARHTGILTEEARYTGRFVGTGGEYLRVMLPGALLSALTFGVYGFWAMAGILRLQLGHTMYSRESG
jgi:uncharacterized membrane protein YjgN (DUF898 family)